jgi:predicted nucleotide-binding protein
VELTLLDSRGWTNRAGPAYQIFEQIEAVDFAAVGVLRQRADMLLKRMFGEQSDYRNKLARVQFAPIIAPSSAAYKESSWGSGINQFKGIISAAIEERLLFGPSSGACEADPASESASGKSVVFIVHGHDEVRKEQVARFVEHLGCEAVILHEQPSQGRTIIEKFEQESKAASYAVVLLTADDFRAAKGEPPTARARQNLVFELGYFVGTLRRANVAALVDPDVERPGDYDGVVWIPLDGGWKLALAKEMKSAKLPIDLNNAV